MMNKMIPTESLQDYYQRTGQAVPKELLPVAGGASHFSVRYTTAPTRKTPFNRRDYYKICLSSASGRGTGSLIYDDQEIQLHPPCLIFTHPSVPASIEISFTSASRYGCIFNKQFIESQILPDVQYASPLFNPALYPIVKLTEEERDRLHVYFGEMQRLQESDYPFKWDMIRNILQLIIHEGVRLQQSQLSQTGVVRDRLVNAFYTLLNQQFPVDSPETSLKLLTPAHFADQLHVHVNHLNSVVKKYSGKSTRTIIHERIVTEAKALLRNTSWNIAEIAYALGFEYPSHFNKYFKQFASVAPMEFRQQQAAVAGNI
ncbi:helix-turn-helix domain-containing protein [Niastella populi]|nr:helix-turn-helix domain-containing protein [Niastella populi]